MHSGTLIQGLGFRVIDTQLLLPSKKYSSTQTKTDMGRRKLADKKPKRKTPNHTTENKTFLFQKQIENRKKISI